MVAVKQMPAKWMQSSLDHLAKPCPNAYEQVWRDLGILRHLNDEGFPYAHDLMGVFSGQDTVRVVTSLAAGCDLASWCQQAAMPGEQREDAMRPLADQLLSAVSWLH